MRKLDTLQVILKVVERCNLACSYCYYFEGGDQSFKSKPPVMQLSVVGALAKFIKTGAKQVGLTSVQIAFHGGEPMMLKPRIFDEMCAILKSEIESVCEIQFTIQTNGTHVTDTWLGLFNKYRVHIGVSIDGMQKEQDRYRKYHNGQGSFSVVAENYKKIKMAQEKIGDIVDIISVLNASNDYRAVLRQLNGQLGVDHFNLLLPDCNRDDGIPNGHTSRDYGKVLSEVFDFWAEHGDIYVREINKLLLRFQLATDVPRPVDHVSPEKFSRKINQIIVVRSDGELQLDDTFIPASEWRNNTPKFDVRSTSMQDYLSLPIFDEIEGFYNNTPDECIGCVWQNICNGGDLENRFSKENGFNNPSVYCDGLKMFYRKVALYLRRNGYPAEVLRARLKPDGHSGVRFAM